MLPNHPAPVRKDKLTRLQPHHLKPRILRPPCHQHPNNPLRVLSGGEPRREPGRWDRAEGQLDS